MGFNMLFYIIIGTNLLTGGPAQNCCFLPILEFCRKGIPNGIQTEWNLRDDLSWTESKPEDLELKSGTPRQQPGVRGYSGAEPDAQVAEEDQVRQSSMIRLQCIYNFWLFHAILYSVLDIIGLYYTLLYYFWD